MANTLQFICTRCLRASSRASTPLSRSHATPVATTASSFSSARQLPALASRQIATDQHALSRRHLSSHSRLYTSTTPQPVAPQLHPHPLPTKPSLSSPSPSTLPRPPTTQSHPSTGSAAPPPVQVTASTIAVLNPQHHPDTGAPLHISITPRAAHRLAKLMQTDGDTALALRITVESGGCHGFQYLMSVTSGEGEIDLEEDTLFVYGLEEQHQSFGGVEGASQMSKEAARSLGNGKAKVVMDSASLELLEGSKVDYTMELIGSQFKIVDNPRATSSCGCGTSFDIKI